MWCRTFRSGNRVLHQFRRYVFCQCSQMEEGGGAPHQNRMGSGKLISTEWTRLAVYSAGPNTEIVCQSHRSKNATRTHPMSRTSTMDRLARTAATAAVARTVTVVESQGPRPHHTFSYCHCHCCCCWCCSTDFISVHPLSLSPSLHIHFAHKKKSYGQKV